MSLRPHANMFKSTPARTKSINVLEKGLIVTIDSLTAKEETRHDGYCIICKEAISPYKTRAMTPIEVEGYHLKMIDTPEVLEEMKRYLYFIQVEVTIDETVTQKFQDQNLVAAIFKFSTYAALRESLHQNETNVSKLIKDRPYNGFDNLK